MVPAIAIVNVVRCVRLLSLFNRTKRSLGITEGDYSQSSSGTDDETRQFIGKPERFDWSSDRTLIALYFILFSSQFIISIIGYLLSDKQGQCNTFLFQALFISPLIIFIVPLIVMAIKLRHVHDAYWLKSEYRAMGIVSVPIGLLCFGLSFGKTLVLHRLSMLSYMLILTSGVVISFVIPSIMALQELHPKLYELLVPRRFRRNPTSHDLLERSASISGQAPFLPFRNYPAVTDVMLDKRGIKLIERHIIDTHDIHSSALLVFWKEAIKFRNTRVEYLPGKAVIIYRKYIERGAFLHISQFSQEQVGQIKSIVENAINESELQVTTVPPELFDDMILTVEQAMLTDLFPSFFASRFFEEYKRSIQLEVTFDA